MAGERYVALGLATARATWFTDVARWATVGSVPLEFVKCVSADEVRVRVASGRAFSTLIVDAATGAVDRDLLDLAGAHHIAVVVVDHDRDGDGDGAGGDAVRDWVALGARATLRPGFGRDELLEVLARTSTMIGGATALPRSTDERSEAGPVGRLVAVTGSGGTGASSVAIGLAQELGRSHDGDVLLADLCLHADQAMLHDPRDTVPGLQELVEAHRSAHPAPGTVRALTFAVVERRYRLLLGVRRHRDWTALRTRSVEAAMRGLLRAFPVVVADTDADVEGQEETGSVDVEERNVLARVALRQADAVVAVGGPGLVGLHALVRVVDELRAFELAPERVIAVVNRSGRNPRTRAECSRAFADLSGASAGLPAVIGPVFVAERRNLDQIHRDGAVLPMAFSAPVIGAVNHVLATKREPWTAPEVVPVVPGSLGHWAEPDAVAP